MKIVKKILLLVILYLAFDAKGQDNISALLSSIEENNPTIAALRTQMDYQRAEARTDLLPPNPSIEGGRFPAVEGAGVKYAWGVSQNFEFPTVYAKRSKLAKANDKFAEVNFNAARQDVLLNAKQSILEYISSKQMLSEYKRREVLANEILGVIQKKVDAGESSAMELNYAKLQSIQISQQRKSIENKSLIIQKRITTLNGNQPFSLIDSTLLLADLQPKNLIEANRFTNDPRMIALDYHTEMAEQNRQLVKQQGMPELTIGYQSERTDAEHFRGFMAGISIPLWGNTGQNRAARMRVEATQAEKQNQIEMLQLEFNEIYLNAQSVKSQLDELKIALKSYNNVNLIQRALEAGEVSVIDLYNELTFLYDITDKINELELEYAKCYADLYRFDL